MGKILTSYGILYAVTFLAEPYKNIFFATNLSLEGEIIKLLQGLYRFKKG